MEIKYQLGIPLRKTIEQRSEECTVESMMHCFYSLHDQIHEQFMIDFVENA